MEQNSNTKTNNTILIAVGLVVLAAGLYFTFAPENKSVEAPAKEAAKPTQTESPSPTPASTPNPEDKGKYLIKSGQVSYTVDKKYVGKEAGKVTGTSPLVTGKGSYNQEKSTIDIKAEADLSGLRSDNPVRDEDVLKILTESKMATFMVNDLEVKKDTKIDTVVTGNLTINGVTKPVEFKVMGTWDEKMVTVEGTATILMTDYNVTPPSKLGIFAVDPKTTLKFNVVAEVN